MRTYVRTELGKNLRRAAGVLALVVGLAWAGLATAEDSFRTKARQAILIDLTSHAVLFEHNADVSIAPASMSKLMTLAVVFRALKSGQLKLEDEFLMSENAWRTGGAPSGTSAMFVPVNTRVTLDELIQGIIVQSGNDAAIAIAEGMAGSEAAFAEVMNTEARRLGIEASTFRNATGLPHPEHRMTVRDLALLARHLIEDYPELYRKFGQPEFNYRKHRFINRNPLLFMKMGVDGLKTGYLEESGYGLVASAVQDGRRLLAVVHGLERSDDRKSEGARLLEWGFKGFGSFKLFDGGEVVGHARVWGGSQFFVPLTGRGELSVVLPRFPVNQKLSAEIVYQGPLKPPVKKGDEVAALRVTSSAGAVNNVPLIAAEDVASAGVIRRGLDTIAYHALGWLP